MQLSCLLLPLTAALLPHHCHTAHSRKGPTLVHLPNPPINIIIISQLRGPPLTVPCALRSRADGDVSKLGTLQAARI